MKNKKKHTPPTSSASRREFIKKSALAATAMIAGCSPKVAEVVEKTPKAAPAAPATGAVLGANDRLVVGFIGVGGQGYNAHLRSVINRNSEGESFHPYEYNAFGAAACDLFLNRREQAKASLEEARDAKGLQGEVKAYEDYRALLDDPAIDAVFIGTVDHWHARIAMDAMEAGKHVYCEKPITRYLDEAFAVHDAVLKTGKKFQIGSQYCTEGKWHKAAELIRAGKIGRLVLCQDSYMRNSPDGEWNYYQIDPELTPQTLDWQQWLGPVHNRPDFNPEHYHRWRKYYPYCAGILGDLLAHRIHPLLIATGNPEFPKRVVCIGNKQITDETLGEADRSVNDNTQLLAEFPSGLCMAITGSSVNEQGLGQVFRGQEATLYFGGNTVELRPERPFADLVDQESFDNIEPGVSIPAHIDNFFDAIRNDKTTNGNIDVAIKTQTIISMAEMSDRLGEMLFFDPVTRTITNGGGKKIKSITYGTLPLS